MTEEKLPSLDKLKILLQSMEYDLVELIKGKKTASVPLRKKLSTMASESKRLRDEILEFRKNIKKPVQRPRGRPKIDIEEQKQQTQKEFTESLENVASDDSEPEIVPKRRGRGRPKSRRNYNSRGVE